MNPAWILIKPLFRAAASQIDGKSLANTSLSLVEMLVNKVMKLDPVARVKIARLSGKMVLIKTQSPKLGISIYVQSQGIQLNFIDANESIDANAVISDADAIIQARCSKLLTLLLNPKMPIDDKEVLLEGDISLISELENLVRNLNIDWAEPLSALLGDTLSHLLVQAGGQAKGWTAEVAQKVWGSTEDYMHHEQSLLATHKDVIRSAEDANSIRLTQARIEQRLARLEACLDLMVTA